MQNRWGVVLAWRDVAADFELLETWRNGDAAAGNELFARHFRSLARFFFNKVDEDEVEDLIQRTFLACVESRDNFRQQSSFRTYLFAVARNELLMHFRRARGRQKVDLSSESVMALGTSPSRAVVRAQEQQRLLTALRELTADQQTLIELHYWEGLGGPELAEVFGIDPTTVRTRLHRTRRALRDAMKALVAEESPAESTRE